MRRRLPPVALLAVLVSALVLAGCGGGETVEPLPETVEGDVPQETVAEGDSAAGEELFASAGCGGCHTYGPAGTNAEIGPNLDEVLEGDDAAMIRSSIVNPNAEITEGFQPNVMPADYGEQLDDQQIADLVAFLQQ
jgi:cytochrome c oxidase subunit II